jgi:SAM-dependent methyltransferase
VSELHPATRGFTAAGIYEHGRPDYPASAIARIAEAFDLRGGRTVLDLAAGTGKLTRLLVPVGASVLAVEPLAEMRAELEQRVPGITVLDGSAEAIPVADGTVDAVTVAQAFHWFDSQRALHEIHRVLTPAGGLALVWNMRDERSPVQAALSEIIDPLQGDTPRRWERDWMATLQASGLFERCERRLFPHEQTVDEQGLVDRILSISFVATAPPAVRGDVEARVRALSRREGDTIRLPYVTELYLGFGLS